MNRRPRQHCEPHLKFIRSLPCVICQDNTSTEAAHVRFSCLKVAKRHCGIAEKPDDKWTVPLCGRHHREQHEQNEQEFWSAAKVDPVFISLALWANSGDYRAGLTVLENAR